MSAIVFTDTAIAYLKKVLPKEALGLRFGVKKAGCSGYEYVVKPLEAVGEKDMVWEAGGLKIAAMKSDIDTYLQGITVDYEDTGFHSGLVFHNPNAEHHCGCGESFNLKSTANR